MSLSSLDTECSHVAISWCNYVLLTTSLIWNYSLPPWSTTTAGKWKTWRMVSWVWGGPQNREEKKARGRKRRWAWQGIQQVRPEERRESIQKRTHGNTGMAMQGQHIATCGQQHIWQPLKIIVKTSWDWSFEAGWMTAFTQKWLFPTPLGLHLDSEQSNQYDQSPIGQVGECKVQLHLNRCEVKQARQS